MKNYFYKYMICAFMAVFISTSFYGQPAPYQNKSPKPTSILAVLPGISSYTFDIEDKEQYNFIEAYFIEELKKWLRVTIPDAIFGVEYRKPSPEHLKISFAFSYNTQLARNGVWWWNVNNARVIFNITGLNYRYEIPLPIFSVEGNNFGNHVLYNNLLRTITNHSYSYNKSSALHLANYMSGYYEVKLKELWRSEGCKSFEGIYEDVISDNGYRNNKYKLAVKYINGKICLIYIGGAYLYNDWKEGEYKAWLEPTAAPNIFKAQWLMSNKSFSPAYITFDGSFMKVSISSNNEVSTYLKLFPTYSDNIR